LKENKETYPADSLLRYLRIHLRPSAGKNIPLISLIFIAD